VFVTGNTKGRINMATKKKSGFKSQIKSFHVSGK